MYLLILESIGTSELILIAVVALIVFGPRKLPQMVKTIGKTMGEFRSATNEFKSTWAREAAFEEDSAPLKTTSSKIVATNDEKSIGRSTPPALSSVAIIAPQVKELSAEDRSRIFPNNEIEKKEAIENKVEAESLMPGKRDWL